MLIQCGPIVYDAGSKPELGQCLVFGGLTLNPLTAKLFNLNFHPLEVVSR